MVISLREIKLSIVEFIQSKLSELFGQYIKDAEFQLGYLTLEGREAVFPGM